MYVLRELCMYVCKSYSVYLIADSMNECVCEVQHVIQADEPIHILLHTYIHSQNSSNFYFKKQLQHTLNLNLSESFFLSNWSHPRTKVRKSMPLR